MSSPSRPVTLVSRPEALAALFGSWDDIDHLLTPLSEEQWRTPTALPGWTVHCVVAHMVGTESMLSGEPTPDVDTSDSGHVRNQIGAMNERWVQHLSGDSGAQLLAKFREVTGRRRAALDAMSDEDWDAVGFTPAGPDSYGRFMRVRVFDCWLHEIDIRDALGLAVSGDAAVGAVALDEMAASMGFVVGKLGGAPEGSRVALELTGPLERVIRVAVDGRAAVVDDFGGSAPTATIRLDALDFARLCGGRVDSAPVAYDGDAEVGKRIVAKLNYVI